jgi:hypothetical protein
VIGGPAGKINSKIALIQEKSLARAGKCEVFGLCPNSGAGLSVIPANGEIGGFDA